MDINFAALIPPFFAASASAWVVNWLKNTAKNYKPAGIAAECGEIRLNQQVAWFTVILGLLIFNFSVLMTVYLDGMLIYGTAGALLGAFSIIGMLPALTQVQNLKWDSQTIQGPSKVYGQIMSIKRAKIKWTSIDRIGFKKGPYFFIETGDETRIYWSPAYSGFEHFESTLREKRPDLEWPKPESTFV